MDPCELCYELGIIDKNCCKYCALAFYINENYMTDEKAQILQAQREAMIGYRDILQNRIINGVY